jgi:putative cardiolipin synthase
MVTLMAGCATATRTVPAEPTYALVADRSSPLGRLAAAVTTGAGADESALHLLASGDDALTARLMLIEQAQRSVDLQYYIFRPDDSGLGLAAALWRAAQRGVRIRLLLDDWGARPDDRLLQNLASHPNIEVRLFNPLPLRRAPLLSLLLDFDRTHRRMHNKLMVADGRAAIVGGRNVGNEYFTRRQEFAFADVDVLAFGPVVPQLARGFDPFWNDALAAPVTPGAREPEGAPLKLTPAQAAEDGHHAFEERVMLGTLRRYVARATAVQDEPGKLDPDRLPASAAIDQEIARVMGDVHSELLIVSPYFVPGEGGVEQLRALTARGVRVKVVTNSLAATDVPAAHAGYARHRPALLDAGVRLYEIRADAAAREQTRGRPGSSRLSLHAKVMVVDRATTFIGSMNIDPRSLRLNTENGIVIESPALGSDVTDGVESALTRDAWRVTRDGQALRWSGREGDARVMLDDEPKVGLWLRLQAAILSWLPIEELL